MTLNGFWMDWFGDFGRELGSNTPHSFGSNPWGADKSRRMFTDKTEHSGSIDNNVIIKIGDEEHDD